MPHSNVALITLHESMVDGRRIEAAGLLLPLHLPIYIERERKKRTDLMCVGEAWCFIDANLGVEAKVHINEDKLPEEESLYPLYPAADLAISIIYGDARNVTIGGAEVRALFLERGSLWDMMPPIYWPEVPPVQYATGTVQVPEYEILDVLDPMPPQQRDMEPWFPWTTP